MYWLTIDKCPHGNLSISLDDEDSGIRLSPDKCCGRTERVKAWPMTSAQMRSAAETMLDAIDVEESK